MTQAEVISDALVDLEKGSRVHVYGLREEPGAFRWRQCDAPDRGEPVVYHVAAEEIGGWQFCGFCGETDAHEA